MEIGKGKAKVNSEFKLSDPSMVLDICSIQLEYNGLVCWGSGGSWGEWCVGEGGGGRRSLLVHRSQGLRSSQVFNSPERSEDL